MKQQLKLIERALKEARKVSRDARYGGLADLDAILVEALEAVNWIKTLTLVKQKEMRFDG